MDKTKEIEGMKLTFSRIGINTPGEPRRLMWIVGMAIFYSDGSKKKTFLEGYPWVPTGAKKKIKVHATTTGFVVATPDEPIKYFFYNAAGEAAGQLPAAEVGFPFSRAWVAPLQPS